VPRSQSMSRSVSVVSVVSALRNPHLWAVSVLTLLLAIVYYGDWFNIVDWIPFGRTFFSEEYLHDIHRALLLVPMLYTAVAFRLKGAIVISLATLCIVLPRALTISPHSDALARALIFVAIASLATVLLGLEQNRRERLKRAYVKLGNAHSELEHSAGQLQASEERYRNLFQTASEAILITSPEGNIVEANAAAVALVGYSLEELQSMRIQQLLADDRSAEASRVQSRWIRDGAASRRREERLRRKDGTEVVVELAAQAMTANGQDVAIQTIARDVTEERRLRDNMQFYIREVTQAQEEERKRIARELHDETAQGLAVLALDIDAISGQVEHLPEESRQRLELLRGKTEALMEGVRRFSHELRPGVLDQMGLAPAIYWLADEMSATHGVETSTEIAGDQRRLTADVELVLFRIAQEALSNVRRHARATRATVRLDFAQDKVRLEVTDNGGGFEIPDNLDGLAVSKKLGILGMQERARIIGADFSLQSAPGGGTTVSVEVTG
jgi:two-component system sensor histidine kinase DegS